MKKIISLVLVGLIGLSIIPNTLTNEKHIVLESTTSVYTKEEVDSLLSAIRTNITNNTNELTNIKSELTALQNSLKDYALKTSLNTTNSNIDGLNTIVTDNTSRIDTIENGKELIATAISNKGVSTNSTDSFETMADNINNIDSGKTLYYVANMNATGTKTFSVTSIVSDYQNLTANDFYLFLQPSTTKTQENQVAGQMLMK